MRGLEEIIHENEKVLEETLSDLQWQIDKAKNAR